MPVESEGRRKALYDKHAAENPVFREYLTKTDRRIPVVVLEPKSA